MLRRISNAVAVAAGALAVAAVFLLALHKISESDTFWHLKTGEWIVTHKKVPRADPFADADTTRAWMDWEWLFQAAIYAVYRVGGFDGLVAAKAAVAALTALALIACCRRNGASLPAAAALALVAFCAARERLEVRPDLAMFLFATTTLLALESARAGKPRWLWLCPLIQVLWVNSHPSFLLGVCLVGAYATGQTASAGIAARAAGQPAGPACRQSGRWWALAAVSAAACLVNPYGPALARHAIEQLAQTGPAGVIGEWQPTRSLLLTEPSWALRLFWAMFWVAPAALSARLAIERLKFPWAHALVLAGASVLALRANRFTALYALLAAPVLAGSLAVIGQAARARLSLPVHRANTATTSGTTLSHAWKLAGGAAAGALALVVIGLTVTDRWAKAENAPARFGLGVDELTVPTRAVAALKQLPADLGLFNTYLAGGYLLWSLYPDWSVENRWAFADSRANLYGRDFLDHYRQALREPARWEQWMREKSVSVAFFQYGTGEDVVLLRHLAQSADWKLAYFDHAACLFVRKRDWDRLRSGQQAPNWESVAPGAAEAVGEYARGLARELAGDDPYDWGRVVATMGNFLMAIDEPLSARPLFRDAVAVNPRISEAWMNLAAIELKLGGLERAMELTDQLLARNRHYYPAHIMQAQIRAARGELDGALDSIQRALRRAPRSAQAWVVRAQIAVLQQDRPTAIRALQHAVAEQAEDATVYWFLARLLAASGRRAEAIDAYENCLRLWTGPPEQRQVIVGELEKLRRPGA
jgi:tetratricopeptide (TPR) repeat protein